MLWDNVTKSTKNLNSVNSHVGNIEATDIRRSLRSKKRTTYFETTPVRLSTTKLSATKKPGVWDYKIRNILYRKLSSRRAFLENTSVSQMKTLNMFYPVIYWTQKVHNNFIFLCSIALPPVSHSSNHEYQELSTYKTIELWFEFLSHF